MSVPWPPDPFRLPEPPRTVTFPDGETIAVQVVPITGFAWDWPADPPRNEEPCLPE